MPVQKPRLWQRAGVTMLWCEQDATWTVDRHVMSRGRSISTGKEFEKQGEDQKNLRHTNICSMLWQGFFSPSAWQLERVHDQKQRGLVATEGEDHMMEELRNLTDSNMQNCRNSYSHTAAIQQWWDVLTWYFLHEGLGKVAQEPGEDHGCSEEEAIGKPGAPSHHLPARHSARIARTRRRTTRHCCPYPPYHKHPWALLLTPHSLNTGTLAQDY